MEENTPTHTEALKNVLLNVFLADKVVNKFHNKVQFMNLNYLMGRAESWSETKLVAVNEALEPVVQSLNEVLAIIDSLEAPALALVESYSLEPETQSPGTVTVE